MTSVLLFLSAAWVAVTAARMYRTFRNTNRRINADLAELRATYEPIDYWPVDDLEWANTNRAVWPMTAGGFE